MSVSQWWSEGISIDFFIFKLSCWGGGENSLINSRSVLSLSATIAAVIDPLNCGAFIKILSLLYLNYFFRKLFTCDLGRGKSINLNNLSSTPKFHFEPEAWSWVSHFTRLGLIFFFFQLWTGLHFLLQLSCQLASCIPYISNAWLLEERLGQEFGICDCVINGWALK